jgi:hypothetical protein
MAVGFRKLEIVIIQDRNQESKLNYIEDSPVRLQKQTAAGEYSLIKYIRLNWSGIDDIVDNGHSVAFRFMGRT